MPTDTTASEDLDITVHHFTRERADERSLSDQVLLDNVAALVTSLRDDAVWHAPRVIDFSVFCEIPCYLPLLNEIVDDLCYVL